MVKVFSMAHSIIGVDEQQVCDPLLYLVKHKHGTSVGKFVEDNPVYSTTMTVRHERTRSISVHCSHCFRTS